MNGQGLITGKSLRLAHVLLSVVCLSLLVGQPLLISPAYAQAPDPPRIANAPYMPYAKLSDYLSEMTIFWFGQVNNTDSYSDVRLAYNDDYLYVYVAVFDRYLWYDTSPGSDLDEWDAVTLYLDLNADGGSSPNTDDHRFVAQVNSWEARTNYQAAFQGNGSGWGTASTSFTTVPGWRGTDFNNNAGGHDDRGWAMGFYIPFSSLGLSGPPVNGTRWGMAVVTHDRDNASGSPPISDKSWPENAQPSQPVTWGQLVFNPPAHQPPSGVAQGTTIIRHGLNGAVVEDAAVGGYATCGDGLDFWTEWGQANYAGGTDFNIQNQTDVADWPCFSKYYVTFPLDQIPAGKVILSASLTLHQYGGAEPSQAEPSLIQVLTIDEDWDEATLTWNNAPLAVEKVSDAWVGVLTSMPPWPGVARQWDVTGATDAAYQAGKPLRLAMYEADEAYHSGKYFVSSDTGDWNAEGRPTLTVVWGQAQAVISKRVYPVSVTNGDSVTYTFTWVGNGEAMTMTDVLPAGLTGPGPISVSQGNASYDPARREVTWTGNPASGQAVTVTFPATVTVDGPLALGNTATLTASGALASSDTAFIIVDGLPVYLPLIFKP